MKNLTILCSLLLGTISFADATKELKMNCSYNPQDLQQMSMSELGGKDGPFGLWYIKPAFEFLPVINLKIYYHYPDGDFRLLNSTEYPGLDIPVTDIKIGVCVYGKRTFFKLFLGESNYTDEKLVEYYEFYRENEHLFMAQDEFDPKTPSSREESTFTKAYPANVVRL